MFRLPLTLTCAAIEPPTAGGAMVLDCFVHDAEDTVVRGRGHMRINVNASASYEDVSSIMQSYANTLSKDLLAAGQAERAEQDEEERMHELEQIIGASFVGVAK